MVAQAVAGWVAATIDAPTASVIVAIIGAVGAVALRLVPKTRPEAARDRSAARLEDAEAWDKLVAALRSENQGLRTDKALLDAQLIAAEAKAIQQQEELEGLRDDFKALKRLMQSD